MPQEEQSSQPTLTVVTINKDQGGQLARTLNSLGKLRERKDVQFLFVDGASSDDSVRLAKTFYAEEEITSEPDQGIYDAMNKGLRRSNGKYVLWLNCGDEFFVGSEDIVMDALQSSTSSIVAFSAKVVDEKALPDGRIWTPNVALLPRGTLPHPSAYFRREVAIELGGYDPSWPISADRDLIIRIHKCKGQIEAHSAVAAIFYRGGVSDSIDMQLENIRLSRRYNIYGPVKYKIKRLILKWNLLLTKFMRGAE